jgi:hypothetical protein
VNISPVLGKEVSLSMSENENILAGFKKGERKKNI